MNTPRIEQKWVYEVDAPHAERLIGIITHSGSRSIPTEMPSSSEGRETMRLIYHEQPPSHLPPETLKYITRVFYVQGCCSDVSWLLYHANTRELICDPNVTLALKTHPKSITEGIIQALSCRSNSQKAVACQASCGCVPKAKCNFKASQLGSTHLLHVISSASEGLFRWGVLDTKVIDKAHRQQLDKTQDGSREQTSRPQGEVSTWSAVSSNIPEDENTTIGAQDIAWLATGALKVGLDAARHGNSGDNGSGNGNCKVEGSMNARVSERTSSPQAAPPPPVCRAYFKIQEAFEFHLPRLGWSLPVSPTAVAVDVGASPGGWTQYLHAAGYSVIAVDPGELHPSVLGLERVRWVPHLLGSNEANIAIEEELFRDGKTLNVVVCDVNVFPTDAARLLKDLLPQMLAGGDRAGGGVACFIFTLKLLKKAKAHHIAHMEDVCVPIFIEGCQEVLQHRGMQGSVVAYDASSPEPEEAAIAAVTCVYQTVHLCANSSNERTLFLKIDSRRSMQ